MKRARKYVSLGLFGRRKTGRGWVLVVEGGWEPAKWGSGFYVGESEGLYIFLSGSTLFLMVERFPMCRSARQLPNDIFEAIGNNEEDTGEITRFLT